MKNPNWALPNRNTLYLARSGGGKSQALKQNPEIPHRGARTILWDPAHDHDYRNNKTHYFHSRSDFGKALVRALASSRGFRIAYDGPRSLDIHEWWCEVVLSILDGRHPTYVIDEEVSRSCNGPGEAPPAFNTLLSEGRKFGLVYHATSQRPQEVSKTVYDNCDVKYVGPVPSRTARYMAEDLDLAPEVLRDQPALSFHRLDPAATPRVQQITLQYRPNTDF